MFVHTVLAHICLCVFMCDILGVKINAEGHLQGERDLEWGFGLGNSGQPFC